MVIGVTGNFGSGKTTVAKMFGSLGAYVIDADKICHSLMRPGKKVYKQIVKHFGTGVLRQNKTINRHQLAEIVFDKKSQLGLLNCLVHPQAIKEINKMIQQNKHRGVLIIDAALLIETGFYKNMDAVIVVRTKRDRQIDRLMRTRCMTKGEMFKRMRLQSPLKKKLALADFVIDNNGSKKETGIQIKKIWRQLGRVGGDL